MKVCYAFLSRSFKNNHIPLHSSRGFISPVKQTGGIPHHDDLYLVRAGKSPFYTLTHYQWQQVSHIHYQCEALSGIGQYAIAGSEG
jgi:hypothetical protein